MEYVLFILVLSRYCKYTEYSSNKTSQQCNYQSVKNGQLLVFHRNFIEFYDLFTKPKTYLNSIDLNEVLSSAWFNKLLIESTYLNLYYMYKWKINSEENQQISIKCVYLCIWIVCPLIGSYKWNSAIYHDIRYTRQRKTY